MALIESRTATWSNSKTRNDGEFHVEGNPWKFKFTVTTALSRVDFYHDEEYVFALVRWSTFGQENQIGYDHSTKNELPDSEYWHTKTMPGELLAAAINVLYNREVSDDA